MASAFSVDHVTAEKVGTIATFITAGLKMPQKQGKIKWFQDMVSDREIQTRRERAEEVILNFQKMIHMIFTKGVQ